MPPIHFLKVWGASHLSFHLPAVCVKLASFVIIAYMSEGSNYIFGLLPNLASSALGSNPHIIPIPQFTHTLTHKTRVSCCFLMDLGYKWRDGWLFLSCSRAPANVWSARLVIFMCCGTAAELIVCHAIPISQMYLFFLYTRVCVFNHFCVRYLSFSLWESEFARADKNAPF